MNMIKMLHYYIRLLVFFVGGYMYARGAGLTGAFILHLIANVDQSLAPLTQYHT